MNTAFMDVFVERAIFIGLIFVGIGFAALLTLGFMYLLILYFRLKKRESMAYEMTTLEVQLPKENEVKIDAAEQMFASFASLKKRGFFSFLEVDDSLAFEIVAKKSDIRFYIFAPTKIIDLVEKTIYGYYPSA